MNEVENYYDNVYDEWERLNHHKIEFDITKRYLDKYIVSDHLEIFDIGGGPGRYSFYLAEKGHKVSLLDLSSKNIKLAKEKAKEFNGELKEYIHGNALRELEFVGVENVLGCREKEINALSEEQYKKWLEIGFKLSTDKNVIGTSHHFLYIGQKE